MFPILRRFLAIKPLNLAWSRLTQKSLSNLCNRDQARFRSLKAPEKGNIVFYSQGKYRFVREKNDVEKRYRILSRTKRYFLSHETHTFWRA